MIGLAVSGHLAGRFCVEALVSLYFYKMNHRPDQPDWPDRDRFVLSKGHAAPALYAVLARCGYFPREELWSLRKLGAMLQGHPDCKDHARGGDFHRFPGAGLAAANEKWLWVCVWTGAHPMFTASSAMERAEGQRSGKRPCSSLITAWIISPSSSTSNGLQIDGACCDVTSSATWPPKWRAFGWEV